MLTLVSFLLALGLLIAVHEYGHYRVAVACGVKVLRFSIGFGKPLWRHVSRNGETEFVLCALPLGGYVRMLDEREGPVASEERHRSFNTQPLRARAAIVAAGPLANLLLAVLLYAAVAWHGVQEPLPVISKPVAGSLAEGAGLRGGERLTRSAVAEDDAEDLQSFEELRWRLTRAALSGHDVRLWGTDRTGGPQREWLLPLSRLSSSDGDAQLLQTIGIVAPWSAPKVGELVPGGAAASAGVRAGDVVLGVDGRAVSDAQSLRATIRAGVTAAGVGLAQHWRLARGQQVLELVVTPKAERQGEAWVGRVGAYIGAEPDMTLVSAGPLEGVIKGVQHTWEVSALSLHMMYKMLVGQASLDNLSGPLTIADYAGRSASLGLIAYLQFLALISVSLGVLNLLPLPVLDGGHLMYYLWEGVSGRPVSEVWMERLQRGGVAVLLALMMLAMFNDIARLLG